MTKSNMGGIDDWVLDAIEDEEDLLLDDENNEYEDNDPDNPISISRSNLFS